MLGRKKRPTSNPPFNNGAPVSSSAASAAAQAFLKNQASSSSLAAAAAGAALRARPVTPTLVAEVQTKRMLRRTASNTSQGSSGGGSLRGQPGLLERRDSNSSMTERTFREPSPNRGSARPSVDEYVPPVPAIPKDIVETHRRTTSMESPPTRIASPRPNTVTGRGSSLGPLPSSGSQLVRKSNGHRMFNLPSVSELTGSERSGSRGQNQVFQKPNLVYDPNTRTFRPQAELLFLEQHILDAANQPVKRKKKIVATQPLVGSHLVDGTAGGRIKGTPVDGASSPPPEAQPEIPPEPIQTRSIAAPRRKEKNVVQQSSDLDSYASTGTSDADSDVPEQPRNHYSRMGGLAKKPSVVREDREQEEAEDEASKNLERQRALTRLELSDARTVSPTPRTAPGLGHGRATVNANFAKSQQQDRSAYSPAPGLVDLAPELLPAKEEEIAVSRPVRVQSVSPVRAAHFMNSPESLAVRHNPPPRAVSPRKSAMKSSASPRGGSPAPEGLGRGHGVSLSDVSDTSTVLSDAAIAPRKKSVRVSFDDERNVVLGQASGQSPSEFPIPQSPPTKRSWFSSMGRGKRKDVSNMEDDDEMMKPRPALPSFGSVREKKVRDIEDRPLVKPTEPLYVPPSPPLTVSPAVEIEFVGTSNDHLVGALLSQEQVSKNAANISKSREPLPPQVTSVEGSGYVSDTSSIYSLEADQSAGERANVVKKGSYGMDVDTYGALAIPQSPVAEEFLVSTEKTNGHGSIPVSFDIEADSAAPVPEIHKRDIPTLAITQASPTIDQTPTMSFWPYMPGGFPGASSDSSLDGSEVEIIEHKPTDQTLAEVGITEPVPPRHEDGVPLVGDIAAQNLHHIKEETEGSENESIYSDAAEDFSDFEGDGFMSLDAVVESPIVLQSPLTISSQHSPISRNDIETFNNTTQVSLQPSKPELDQGWDEAQAYWSGLTADKKRQMEEEALQNETSVQQEAKPAPKSKQKKKIAVRAPVAVHKERGPPRRQPMQNRTYQIVPGAKAGPDGMPAIITPMRANPRLSEEQIHIRKSMRPGGGEPSIRSHQITEENHMRTTMRNGAGGSMRGPMRGSMRGSSEVTAPVQPKGSSQRKYRPLSHQPPLTVSDPAEGKNHIRNISAEAGLPSQIMKSAPRKAPPLRTDSMDSDFSDSSFKRARPSSEGFSMKRSMRGPDSAPQVRHQSPEISNSKTRSSRFSLRSLSPTGSTFRRDAKTNVQYSGMPMTMRGNRPDAPTLRAAPQKAVATRSGGFGRSKPTAAVQPKSRLNDSSDEEDAVSTFRSRFVDSSDEEDMPEPAFRPITTMRSAPARATPRVTNVVDGDSSDLTDSDDENEEKSRPAKPIANVAPQIPPATTALNSDLRRSGSGRGTRSAVTVTNAITGGRPEQKRRGSFISNILRRKKDPGSKVRKSDAESPARRDTPLERSRSEVKAVKRQDSSFSTFSGVGGKKLEKRVIPKRMLSEDNFVGEGPDWPLSSAAEEKALGERPNTADAAADVLPSRPDIGDRRATATGLSVVDLASASGTAKKKKKFGRLRRALGLDD